MNNVYVSTYESDVFKFPAGEIGVRVKDSYKTKVGECLWETIVAHVKTSDDVITILMLNDALKRNGVIDVQLVIPYVPYARQDRVCNPGEALSIKVFADLINSCNFDRVFVTDPHSDVLVALINNVVIKEQHTIFGRIPKDWANTIIIAPDGGALKKAEKFAKYVKAKGVVAANKKRNVLTGEIEYVKLTESVDNEHVFVLDDILEGAGTFFMLATQLAYAKSKELAVTHGIFSKGFDILTVYDKVYTTNSYHPDLESRDNLVVFKI